VLRVLAAGRSPDSYIADGVAINRKGPRFSRDPDLATNRASAAADRREPRDIVDLVTIHEGILPLGTVICDAVGRFPGQSPEEMPSDIISGASRFTAEEFRAPATERPLDVSVLHRRIRSMLEDAERFISRDSKRRRWLRLSGGRRTRSARCGSPRQISAPRRCAGWRVAVLPGDFKRHA
jgi:hypothetical protein